MLREFEKRARPVLEAANREAAPLWTLQVALDDMNDEEAAQAIAEHIAGDSLREQRLNADRAAAPLLTRQLQQMEEEDQDANGPRQK